MHEQILSPASPLLNGIKENVSSAVASGTILIIAGSYMATQPVAGLASITLILVAYLVVTALFEWIIVFQIRPVDGWGLALFSGTVTLASRPHALASVSAVRRLGGRRPVWHQDIFQRMLALIHRYYCDV